MSNRNPANNTSKPGVQSDEVEELLLHKQLESKGDIRICIDKIFDARQEMKQSAAKLDQLIIELFHLIG